jgi:hypothetical protein
MRELTPESNRLAHAHATPTDIPYGILRCACTLLLQPPASPQCCKARGRTLNEQRVPQHVLDIHTHSTHIIMPIHHAHAPMPMPIMYRLGFHFHASCISKRSCIYHNESRIAGLCARHCSTELTQQVFCKPEPAV